MSKKDNFSQAMFEMFGLGKAPEEEEDGQEELSRFDSPNSDPVPEQPPVPADSFTPVVDTPTVEAADFEARSEFDAPAPEFDALSAFAAPSVPAAEPAPAAPAPAAPAPAKHEYVRRENCTYFAPGTSMEGTLRSDSDVEIVGDFKGEIASDGKVTIHSNTQSSIAAAELVLIDCSLTGDAMVSGDVSINESSSVSGNIRAASISCSGTIKGNLNVQGNIILSENAQVIGDIKTGTLAMSRGAKVSGKIDMGG